MMHAEFSTAHIIWETTICEYFKTGLQSLDAGLLNHKRYNETNKVNISNMRIPL